VVAGHGLLSWTAAAGNTALMTAQKATITPVLRRREIQCVAMTGQKGRDFQGRLST
jgi:hypothetical protein